MLTGAADKRYAQRSMRKENELITYEHTDPKGVTYLLDVPIDRTKHFEQLRREGFWISMVYNAERITRKDTGEVIKDRHLTVINGKRYNTRTPIDDLRES